MRQAPVVNNPAPRPDAPSFVLSATPVVTIGGLNDDERYELLGVGDVELTSSGQIALAPYARPRIARSTEVRIFDMSGRFVRRFGREGQGPGEYQSVGSITALPGDSLLILDQSNRRITLVDGGGNVAGTTTVPGSGACCFADGSFLVWTTSPRRGMSASGPRERPAVAYSVASVRAPAVPPREIVTLRGNDPTLSIGPFQRVIGGRATTSFNTPPFPFGRTAYVAVAASTIVYGNGDRYEYEVYSPDGTLVRTVRAAAPPVPVTREHIARRRESLMGVAVTPEMKAGFERTLDQITFPTTMPAYGGIEVEPQGTVWVRSYDVPDDTSSVVSWARFDPSGRLLGTLRIPPGMGTARRFTRGYAILVRYDRETETTTVRMHRIEPIDGR
jgi:hypothetical protein